MKIHEPCGKYHDETFACPGRPVRDMTRTTMVEPCPECAAGKCGNCNGDSWDKAQDCPASCPCADNDHPRRSA